MHLKKHNRTEWVVGHTKFIDLLQGSQEWIDWRMEGLGGSDIAALLGIAPYDDATRGNLFLEKTGRFLKEINYAMKRGNDLEKYARWRYENRRGLRFPPICAEHLEHPWMRCSLDGYNGQANRIPEIKALHWKYHRMALLGYCPDFIECQIQYQMMITGIKEADFVDYNPGLRFDREEWLAIVPIQPNAEWQAQIFDLGKAFWEEVLEYRGELVGF